MGLKGDATRGHPGVVRTLCAMEEDSPHGSFVERCEMKDGTPKASDLEAAEPRRSVHRIVRRRAPAGYYFADVPAVHCLMCDKPIGKRPYREVRILARFGQMLFEHKHCEQITESQ